MRDVADQVSKELNTKPGNIFNVVKFMKKDGKDNEGGRCMRGKMEDWVSVRKTELNCGKSTWADHKRRECLGPDDRS